MNDKPIMDHKAISGLMNLKHQKVNRTPPIESAPPTIAIPQGASPEVVAAANEALNAQFRMNAGREI